MRTTAGYDDDKNNDESKKKAYFLFERYPAGSTLFSFFFFSRLLHPPYEYLVCKKKYHNGRPQPGAGRRPPQVFFSEPLFFWYVRVFSYVKSS